MVRSRSRRADGLPGCQPVRRRAPRTSSSALQLALHHFRTRLTLVTCSRPSTTCTQKLDTPCSSTATRILSPLYSNPTRPPHRPFVAMSSWTQDKHNLLLIPGPVEVHDDGTRLFMTYTSSPYTGRGLQRRGASKPLPPRSLLVGRIPTDTLCAPRQCSSPTLTPPCRTSRPLSVPCSSTASRRSARCSTRPPASPSSSLDLEPLAGKQLYQTHTLHVAGRFALQRNPGRFSKLRGTHAALCGYSLSAGTWSAQTSSRQVRRLSFSTVDTSEMREFVQLGGSSTEDGTGFSSSLPSENLHDWD